MQSLRLGAGALVLTLNLASAPAIGGERAARPAAPIVGTWNVGSMTEGCHDVTGEHRGETWTFEAGGGFVRTRPGADGRAAATERGRWKLVDDGRLVRLTLTGADGATTRERYPVMSVDEKKLELLRPTEVKRGVVIAQERFTAFYHS